MRLRNRTPMMAGIAETPKSTASSAARACLTRHNATSRNDTNHYFAMLSTKLASRSSPSYDEMHRVLSRLHSHRTVAEGVRSRQTTLADILSSNYTVDLPSAVSANGFNSNQASEIVAANNTSAQQGEPEAHFQSNNSASTLAASSHSRHGVSIEYNTETSSQASPTTQRRERITGLLDWSQDSEDELTSESESSSKESNDESDSDDGSERGDSLSASMSISPGLQQTSEHEDMPDEARRDNLQSQRRIDKETSSDLDLTGATRSNVTGAAHVENVDESESEAAAGDSTLTLKIDREKNRLAEPAHPEEAQHSSSVEYSDWIRESIPGTSHSFTLRKPTPPDYDPDSTSNLEEPLDSPPQASSQTPTANHLNAVARLPPSGRLNLINEFLDHNAARIDTFRTRQQTPPVTFLSKSKANETASCEMWNSPAEIDILTDAMLWLDALLSNFRTDILTDDTDNLKPLLEQATRVSQQMRNPRTISEGLDISERMNAETISNYIAKVQASNYQRRQLLKNTNIDVEAIQDLLELAEITRYQRGHAREHDHPDALLDALRRIYSTVVCTIPVGLSEDDEVYQPPQKPKTEYIGGPFNLCVSSNPPKIFGEGYTGSRVSGEGYAGPKLAGERTLSNTYF